MVFNEIDDLELIEEEGANDGSMIDLSARFRLALAEKNKEKIKIAEVLSEARESICERFYATQLRVLKTKGESDGKYKTALEAIDANHDTIKSSLRVKLTLDDHNDPEDYSYFAISFRDVPRSKFLDLAYHGQDDVKAFAKTTDLGKEAIPESIPDLADRIFQIEDVPGDFGSMMEEAAEDVLGLFKDARGLPAQVHIKTLKELLAFYDKPEEVIPYFDQLGLLDTYVNVNVSLLHDKAGSGSLLIGDKKYNPKLTLEETALKGTVNIKNIVRYQKETGETEIKPLMEVLDRFIKTYTQEFTKEAYSALFNKANEIVAAGNEPASSKAAVLDSFFGGAK
jgi:hypothetical protein